MTPLKILNDSRNRKVEIHTSEQDIYTGILRDFDMYVNISLRDAEFLISDGGEKRSIGDTIIQGNLVTFVRLL